MNDTIRWQIFRVLRFPFAAKDLVWTRLNTLAVDTVWLAEVIAILDKLIAADDNPNTLFGSTDEYEPGLKKLDVIEWYQGVKETEVDSIYQKWWTYLANLVGRENILEELDPDSTDTSAFGFGFS